jgi:hypothetical protein
MVTSDHFAIVRNNYRNERNSLSEGLRAQTMGRCWFHQNELHEIHRVIIAATAVSWGKASGRAASRRRRPATARGM